MDRRQGWSCLRVMSAVEAWATGYEREHLQLGLQMAVCFVLSLIPLIVSKLFSTLDKGSSVLYTAITVAVVLEPSTGDSFRKAALRLSGAGLGCGVGLLALLCAGEPPDDMEEYNEHSREIGGWVAGALALLGFILKTNAQRFWQHHEFWGTALFTLPIVTVPAVRCTAATTAQCLYYRGAVFRFINVLFGVAISAVVSFVVFPVRARGLLQKKMARTLLKIGDLAVWLLGQACVMPQMSGPAGRAALPGSTGSDHSSMYCDDGLRKRLAPLMATAAELNADLAYMGKLLEAARTEVYLLRTPRKFPAQQYRNLLDSCHTVMGIFLSLLDSLQSGDISLECCQRHIGDLSEAGVRISAAFIALSTIIRPPKDKQGKKKGEKEIKAEHRAEQQQRQQLQAAPTAATPAPGGGGGGGEGRQRPQPVRRQSTVTRLLPAGPSAAAAIAAVEAAEAAMAAQNGMTGAAAGGPAGAGGAAAAGWAGVAGPPVLQVAGGSGMPPLQFSAGDVEAAQQAQHDDDPFAGLEDWPAEPTSRVVALSNSQLVTAQQMARHLSRVMTLSQRPGTAARQQQLGALPALDAPLEGPEGSTGAASSAADSVAQHEPGGSECGEGSIYGGVAGQGLGTELGHKADQALEAEQQPGSPRAAAGPALELSINGKVDWRERARGKLVKLVDSVRQLELDAYEERQRDPNAAGLPAFMLLVHACLNTTRQCGACFTALDPERGAALQAYFLATRKSRRLEQPVSL